MWSGPFFHHLNNPHELEEHVLSVSGSRSTSESGFDDGPRAPEHRVKYAHGLGRWLSRVGELLKVEAEDEERWSSTGVIWRLEEGGVWPD